MALLSSRNSQPWQWVQHVGVDLQDLIEDVSRFSIEHAASAL